jgi:hypothetical protein
VLSQDDREIPSQLIRDGVRRTRVAKGSSSEAGLLELPVDRFLNREGSVVQDCPKQPHVGGLQQEFRSLGRVATRRVGLQHQHNPIADLGEG